MSDPNSPSDEKQAQVLSRALSALPPRRAPASLESRVFMELARRDALPWWQRSFMHWPAVPRTAFVLICVALASATFWAGASTLLASVPLTEWAAHLLTWLRPPLALLASVGALATLLVRILPAAWLYAGMVLGILMYVALFGLGAAAYRTLYLRPMTGNGS